MKIDYENNYLKNRFSLKYINFKKTIKHNNSIGEIKTIMFGSLGLLVTLSQISEFVLNQIDNLYLLIINEKNHEIQMENFTKILDTVNLSNIELSKSPSLGKVLGSLEKHGIVEETLIQSSLFINKNRNNFVHNYMMNNPKVLLDIELAKEFTLGVYYTALSLNQLVEFIYDGLEFAILNTNPDLKQYLQKFKCMFIENLEFQDQNSYQVKT